MYLSDVLAWIKTKFSCAKYYSGRADTNDEEYLALYELIEPNFSGVAVGSKSMLSYDVKVVKFILRYGRNSDISEKKARELYDVFLPNFDEPVYIADHRIVMFKPATPAPQALGTDTKGNFMYSIDVTIYYER